MRASRPIRPSRSHCALPPTGSEFPWTSNGFRQLRSSMSSASALSMVCGAFPAVPYRNMDGALRAIRFAREARRPFLGTCGGFQHAVVEYARNVLGWSDAEHAETAPGSARPVVTLLECGLIEATDTIFLKPGTRIHEAYGRPEIVEGYRCRFGLNQAFLGELTAGHLKIGAEDRSGDVERSSLMIIRSSSQHCSSRKERRWPANARHRSWRWFAHARGSQAESRLQPRRVATTSRPGTSWAGKGDMASKTPSRRSNA